MLAPSHAYRLLADELHGLVRGLVLVERRVIGDVDLAKPAVQEYAHHHLKGSKAQGKRYK